MTALFNRWIPSITLAIWSGVLLLTFFTGRVTAFLHPSFRPGVLIAGATLAALALFIASRSTPPECCADATCTHPLSRSKAGRWLTFLVLVLPVSVAAWLSPEHFSKQLIENRGVVTDAAGLGDRKSSPTTTPLASPAQATPATDAPPTPAPAPEIAKSTTVTTTPPPATAPSSATAPTSATSTNPAPAPQAPSTLPTTQSGPNPQNLPEYIQRSAEGYIVAEILDLLYSVQDSQLRKDFEGKTVQLIAQAMPDKTSASNGGGRFKAVRMFMTCCAADARPVATLIQFNGAADLAEMSWVKIIGKATFPVENGKRISLVEATSVTPSKPPEESMLFQ